MRMHTMLASAGLALTVVACDVSERAVTTSVGDGPSFVISQDPYPLPINCPSGYECKYATDRGPIDALPSVLETSCGQEACGGQNMMQSGSISVLKDGGVGYADLFKGTCTNGTPFSLPSDSTACWDCTEGCAGSTCPPGERCSTILRQPGSDCRRFACEAGYTLVTEAGHFIAPTCRRAVTTAPAAPSVTATRTSANLPQLQWAAVSGANGYRIYRRLEWQADFDSWDATTETSYTDGSTIVSGAPKSSAPSSGKWVAYYVKSYNSVGESSGSAIFYYPYTGIAPY